MITQSFRDVLPKAKRLGDRVVEQLDDIISQFTGLWNVQHKDDGAHGDITADSLEVAGDVIINGDVEIDGSVSWLEGDEIVTLEGLVLGPGTLNDYSSYPAIGFTADITVPVLQTNRDFIPTEDGEFDLGIGGDATFQKRWRTGLFSNSVVAPILGASSYIYTAALQIGSGVLQTVLTYSTAQSTLMVSTHASPVEEEDGNVDLGVNGFSRWRNLWLGGGIFEAGRTVAQGYWQNQAFSAGDFTASAGTWTVDSGDQVQLRYTLIGKTMVVSFSVIGTDVSATPVNLRIKIPGGFTAGSDARNCCSTVDAGGAAQFGMVLAVSANTDLFIYRDATGGTAWSTTAADNTSVVGTITFEIQ